MRRPVIAFIVLALLSVPAYAAASPAREAPPGTAARTATQEMAARGECLQTQVGTSEQEQFQLQAQAQEQARERTQFQEQEQARSQTLEQLGEQEQEQLRSRDQERTKAAERSRETLQSDRSDDPPADRESPSFGERALQFLARLMQQLEDLLLA